LNATSCVDECPSSTFADVTEKKCKACPKECATCLSSGACKSCYTDKFLDGSKCVTDCVKGEYGNTKTRTCDTCDATC